MHAGQAPEPVTGAVMTPVFLTSTYAQKAPGHHTGFEYSRTQNPTRFALEANLAALEGGAWGLAFNAGVAASAAVLTLLDAGDHVVAGDDLYGGSYRLFDKVFRRLGVTFSQVDARDPARRRGRHRPEDPPLLAGDAHQSAAAPRRHPRRSRASAPPATSGCASTTPS